LIAGSLTGSAITLAAESTEKLTRLPLHEGLTFQQEVSSPVCGKAAKEDVYDNPSDATLAEYITWYKQQLNSFHYVHKVWSNRAQEMFYSADGSKGVSITGIQDGEGVFNVVYLKMSSRLTTHQEDAFDPSNPSCK
jgi:hypothetical protein